MDFDFSPIFAGYSGEEIWDSEGIPQEIDGINTASLHCRYKISLILHI